ncbi:protein tilB [Agrilus planipennis]|uniref:Protein tilB n=1 Tax=Agrilus planipennis TaxID=224129 RepID=A0A1W4XTJ2_AGRPL|nr:protein tilB [Agrilus planipennis]
MVKITEELIRKKSEHNEGIIGTLEELSLHQEDVDKIENLNNWCKDLQILLLQANLISKIENLNKLKKLEYLNLAVNNVEKIENLERCEFLEKLDLTLNFIGDLESVASLKNNLHLRHLYLTGNPCTNYEGYRTYVVAVLPQLQTLDGVEITHSERIKAQQDFENITPKIRKAQKEYELFRKEQKERLCKGHDDLTDEEFWATKSEHAPEIRVEMAMRSRKSRNTDEEKDKVKKPCVRLYNKEGRPLNINQAKLKFKFCDEDPKQYVLDIAIYKYLDTSLIDVDLQPIVVKVTIKKKVFQFVLPEEIYTDKSVAQRSQTTGHLVITMPRMNYKEWKETRQKNKPKKINDNTKRHEYLEITGKQNEMDFSNIVSKIDEKTLIQQIPPLEYF